MARTFVQDGVTTEYATHVIGTTVGDRYAHIVSTGSRVFYDNIKPTNRHDTPEINLQTILDNLGQTQAFEKTKEEDTNLIEGNQLEPSTTPETVNKLNVSVRQELSVRKIFSPEVIKPAKVNAKNGLPTFTVKSSDDDYFPVEEQTTKRDDSYKNKLRSSKNLFRNGFKPIEIKKYETVTYFGFADFMTTVGNTVIIFMPKTPAVPEATSVTSIKGEATLRPEDIISPTKSITLSSTKTLESTTEKVEYNNVIESSIATTEETMAMPTEPLSRRISETTRVFNNEQEALGLLKTIGGVDVIDSKTTRLTTFFYGTYINGKYTQLEQTVSTLLSKPSQMTKTTKIEIPMTKIPTSTESQTTTEKNMNEVTTESEEEISTTPEEETISPSSSTEGSMYKTYTYLTTFFIPVDESLTTTSVKSRIVLSPESTHTTETTMTQITTTTTESIPTTTSEDEDIKNTTTEEIMVTTEKETENKEIAELTTVPMKDNRSNEEVTTEKSMITESNDDVMTTEMSPTTIKPEEEEEVELLFKTLYTTYTYLTTFFQESTTSVLSREEVVTNIVTSTLEKDSFSTDPAVAGLFDREEGNLINSEVRETARNPRILATRVGSGRPSSAFLHKPVDDLFVSTLDSVDFNKELATPPLDENGVKTFSKTYTYFTTLLSDGSTNLKSHTEVYTNVIMPSNIPFSQRIQSTPVKDTIKSTISEVPDSIPESMDDPGSINEEMEEKIETKKDENNDSLVTPSYKYDMTITRNRTNYNNIIDEEKPVNDVIGESMVTDTKSSSSNNIKRKVSNDEDEDMESSENNENIESSPTNQLQTSFTTYTYFTTIYKGSSSSEVISRFETITNVAPHTIEPTEVDNLNGEETTLPVTFFTTYTYWTTLYKDGNTLVTSREDTLTNVMLPSISDTISNTPAIEPSSSSSMIKVTATEKPLETEPTTYFTTFTYFTTSYVDNETIVNSRLETVTNVINTTDTNENINNDGVDSSDSVIKTTPEKPLTENVPMPVLKPTGLISSITTQEVNKGETTSFTTDVYGTYIDGLYAQILESRSNVVKNVTPSEVKSDGKSTGVVALNEGKIVDADGVSTTFYTTKAIGTYIDQLYAQVIESTSSIKVNDNKKIVDPSTIVLGAKTYRTGLLSLIEGTSVKDLSTTFYETKVIGKVVDGKYTQEFESDSKVNVGVQPTVVQEIKASSTQLNEIFQSELPITPSPAAIESSLGENGSKPEKTEETDEDNSTKKKTFPVIRPFASRPRPTFQPKKKATDSLSAATINRSITPTIVATPALKTNEKGIGPSSRNRFSGVRKSSSSQLAEIIPSSSNSRKYSRSKIVNTPIVSPSVNFKNRTPSSAVKITPTSSLSSYGSSRRSSFNQRQSSSKLQDNITPRSSASSRFRIRPTASSNFNRFSSTTVTTTTPTTEEIPDNNEVSTSLVTDETLLTSNNEEEENITQPTSTTTESTRRGNNPLLKLRRPPLPKTPITTQSPRRNPARTTARTTTSTTTTTPRPQRPKTPSPLITRNRPKPVNGLFPSRGLGKKELEQEVTSETSLDEEKLQQEVKDDEVIEDNEDGAATQVESQSNTVSETERPSRGGRTFNNQVQIRPFNSRRSRTRRQIEFGNKYDNSRSYRSKQPVKNTNADYYYDEYVEQEPPATTKAPTPKRQPSRSRQQQRVTPTTSSSNVGRSQFTLREKTPTTTAPAPTLRTSNYRRTRPPVQQETTTSKRISRLRYPTTTPEPVRNNRRYTPSSRRQNTRTRFREDLNTLSNTQSIYDGSITVTHKIPTELTIPIVIGTNTEYKQVLTAKPSIEILGPHQYSTVAGKNGLPTIQLIREVTETLPNGATEITKFVVYEQATSIVTFTPTYIRGRKTSYSHIIPSTIYDVKPEVNTIQPQLANAPLANLLLSQLLLGNLGIQPTVNPLLALNSGMAIPQSPITDYKTKSTTYVTTVTHSTSTVLPLTFRGKVISTTIIDSSTNVITATEYITETIVTTPTIQQPNNQLNTLLLPALLQAQLLGQATPVNNLLGSIDSTQDELLQELIEPTPKYGDDTKPAKKKAIIKKPPDPIIQPDEASVVTLYVSGKRPGEFSTVLSTVNYDETATVRKREVEPSSVMDLMATKFGDILLSPTNDDPIQRYNEEETQSLESIIGDVSKNVKIENRATKVNVVFVEPSQQTQETTGHFLWKGSADSPVQREVVNSKIWSSKNRTKRNTSNFLPDKDVFLFNFPKIPKTNLTQSILYNVGDRENSSFTFPNNLDDYKIDAKADEQRGFDERRFNFATKKMSNGVEVIVAGDKSTYPGQASVLRVLPTSQAKPITLAPSTLTDHMLMMLPHPIKQSMNNQFVTKTYLTTYTYLTTFLDREATVVSSREKIVSNVVTDELNKITPTATLSQVTLTASPSLETGVYHTTYTYLNTFVDGDIPLVMTSRKTVANTVTAPHEFLTPLQPSEPAYYNTNTYLNTVSFTKTLSDGPDFTVVSTEDILTQVVITKTDNTPTLESSKLKLESTTTDMTKTYYVTYTYYNTIQDGDSTVVKSDISVSSDIVTEKYLVPTKINEIQPTPTVDKLPFHLYATKTYLTTFTYFTTLLKDNDGKNPSSTHVKSRTKIVQNIVTESLNASIFNSNYLSSISSSVQNVKLPITATATLDSGQIIEFTAMNDLLPSEPNAINPSHPIPIQETLRPIINENISKPNEKLKETIKPSSVSKLSQKTEIQKPPKKNSPPKSEQKIPLNTISDNTNVGGLIDFGTIGSSLTALKPVISAVAGIIQNNLKNDQKIKNVHLLQKSTPKPVKQETTSRAPIYIPVGGLADSIGSETHQYPDTDQRHPHVGPSRPPVESSLMSGGIPISPGEVITTNSDVIIGKPSVLGPRPPMENLRKDEIPFGMRPPPPPIQFKDKISIPNNVAREHIKNPLPHTDRKNNQPVRYHENRVQAQYQLTNVPVKSEVNIIPLSKPDPWPTKFVTDVQPLVLTSPDIQPEASYGNQNLITSNQPSFLEQSAIDPLLVNIQPSQVAQVVIPHGSQTALIYSDQPAVGHGPKGEIFNDPQPYPENHVNPGFVGLEIYGTVNPTNNVASKIPTNAIHFDVPVSPAGITVGDSESHHLVLFDNETGEVKTRPVHILKPQKPQTPNNQYLTPPSISQVNSFVRRPDAALSVEDDLLQFEDGEVTQESKKTPLRPGELPFGVHSSESDEDKTPIITGKPHVNNFNGEEQILSIGQPIRNTEPTELKPGNFIVPNQKRPDLQYNIQHSQKEHMSNNTINQNKLVINVPSMDDIKQAMNMDEKLPPLPTNKHEINDLDSQGSTPQPSVVKPNLNNEVLGLSPPPMITHSLKYDNVTQRPQGSRRPYRPKPKPSTTPPYQFERPPNRRPPLKPPNNQEEMVLRPLSTTAKIEPIQKWEASLNARPEYRPPHKEEKPVIMNAESKVVSQGSNIKLNVQEKTKEKTVISSDPVINVIPTLVTQDTTKWYEYSPISSTEGKIETVQSTTETPALTSTTIGIIKSYTTPSKPTSKTTDYHSVISVVIKNEEKSEEKSSESAIENPTTPKQKSQMRPQVTILQLPERPSFMDEFHKQLHQGSSLPTRFVTHTQTLSVTVTETTVLQSDGNEPSTHTLVLTKTQTSTLVDTVTEFHTLVKPTQVLSTITTTIPVPVHSDPVLLAPVVEGTKTKTVNVLPDENETLLVVMTDKKGGSHGIPPEIQVPDETNEIGPSDVLLSGILTHSSDTECRPECKASKNEICQRIENTMRCVCRPGFARMFMDRPCKPTYTYTMKLVLDRFRKEPIKYSTELENPSSNQYQKLTEATREGLNRMSMQSDLRDIYHGVIVGGYEPAEKSEKAVVSYIIQLSENAEDSKLWEAIKKSLRVTNYSLGGTEVFAARDQLQLFSAEDFDECSDSKFHDCSDNAKCFNLHGTYTCSCKDGFTDLSHNTQFPGRVCSSELIGCDLCNYHGTCYLSNQDQTICECFQWYAGKHCQFNLRVLLLGLIAIGVMLLSLLIACLLMTCCKKRSRESVMGLYQPQRPVIGFRRYRNMIATTRGDKRAMISVDTGSETSVDHTPPPYVKQVINMQRQTHAHVHSQMKTPSPSLHEGSTMRSGLEQRDRSLTVMIPRAKYRPTPQQAPSILTMSTFGPEQKVLSYNNMESRQTPTKGSRCSSRKPSDSTQRSVEIQPPQRKKHAAPRKPSTGALVSAGFEVSATVVKTKELEEAYVSRDDDKPDFNTGRTTAARTVSVARSFDETTVQPPTRCYPDSHYESKSQYSHKTNDEGHTMVERDLGSTYLMPQSKLYKPDNRGSDTSNFDSL
ncbi:EGF-like, conserved site,EGF-like calcium-binding domain,SEA domain,EGF-like calcium-binding [Cinara cedri]|uniref:EGF-like, conserved site,EGF-like calcium-binding domain,SEA domain,EGF-like calcium-binding n=1 Tax=Cinara cedri TaxID=506608 RepID=A0A5E4NFD1_9HEMI|nr:EGF-like, conserved site,EGF-like calcium-binding domain,SEA domain,EGF-like calcium-binding [Cinara cedri]